MNKRLLSTFTLTSPRIVPFAVSFPAREQHKKRARGVTNNRFLYALRSKKLGRTSSPETPPTKIEITRLKGGSFNRISGVTVVGSDHEDPVALILRTSRVT